LIDEKGTTGSECAILPIAKIRIYTLTWGIIKKKDRCVQGMRREEERFREC